MAEPDTFEKTPKKATRWFRTFVVLSLLYGITFSLNSFFNWIFFFAAIYSLFMSYFLLPVQPKVFQARPKQQWRGPQSNAGREGQPQSQSAGSTVVNPAERAKKVIIGIVAIMFALFMIPFTIGLIEGFSGEESDIKDIQEEFMPEESVDPVVSHVSKGNDFFNDQNYDSADYYYDKALAINGGYGEAIYGKGIVAFQRGRADEANRFFLRAYEGGFRYAWLSWVLADMYDKQGQTFRATELYKESVNLDSTYVDSYKRLAELEPALAQKYLDLAERHKAN